MLLTPEQYGTLNGTEDHHTRGIAPIWARLWDIPVNGQKGKVGVPYKIDPEFSNQQREKILNGMKEER